jgi:hypothetical protein
VKVVNFVGDGGEAAGGDGIERHVNLHKINEWIMSEVSSIFKGLLAFISIIFGRGA